MIETHCDDGAGADVGATPTEAGGTQEFEANVEVGVLHVRKSVEGCAYFDRARTKWPGEVKGISKRNDRSRQINSVISPSLTLF